MDGKVEVQIGSGRTRGFFRAEKGEQLHSALTESVVGILSNLVAKFETISLLLIAID